MTPKVKSQIGPPLKGPKTPAGVESQRVHYPQSCGRPDGIGHPSENEQRESARTCGYLHKEQDPQAFIDRHRTRHKGNGRNQYAGADHAEEDALPPVFQTLFRSHPLLRSKTAHTPQDQVDEGFTRFYPLFFHN